MSDPVQRRETSHEQRFYDAKGKAHVVEQPPASIGHRQPSTNGLVNGQDSNEQVMHQTIQMLAVLEVVQFSSYFMPGANMGMAGFAQPYAQNMNMTGKTNKEWGQAVKFDTFHGTHDKLKALLFLRRFDAAFAGGNFTESSKAQLGGKLEIGKCWFSLTQRACANFISPELASKLGIRAKEMGMKGEIGLACPGHSEPVTPILGKLRLHIQSYVDAKEIHIMPLLQDCDVLLGIPWCYKLNAVVDTFQKKITLVHRGKTHVLDVKLKGESVPVVSASAISSIIKNHLFGYLIFAKEVHEVESNLSKLHKDRAASLNGFRDCFSNSLPDELLPKRPEDHSIDLEPSSSPPYRPPYRIIAAQQQEIMSQVNELLEKGLIQSKSSPFCSPVLLVQKKDGFLRMCIDYHGMPQSLLSAGLKLPIGWNAFHVSLVRPFVGDVPDNLVPEEKPKVEELDKILVPEQILAHKERKVRGKVARRYLVKVKNFSIMDAKWMEEAELVDSP
ncbi:hypothetical protein L7F22_067682 [Adiantum nelumboides]|nr:hypothetical protein [Adiantum nelumboides]